MNELLEIRDDNMVSAKELYEKLGLSESNYSRWCKQYITENEALEEGIDYKADVSPLVINDEWENTGFEPNYRQDYLLTLETAASLAMESHTKKGRELRDRLLKAAFVAKAQYDALIVQFQNMSNAVEQLGKKFEESYNILGSRVMALESGRSVPGGKVSEWFSEAYKDISDLVATGYWGSTFSEVLSAITEKMGVEEGVDISIYTKYYMQENKLQTVPNKLYVIDDNSDLRYVFEKVVDTMLSCIDSHGSAADDVAIQSELEAEMFEAPEGYSYPDEVAGIPGRGVPTPEELHAFEKKQKEWLETERDRIQRKREKLNESYIGPDNNLHYYDEEKEKQRIIEQEQYKKEREADRARSEERKKYFRGMDPWTYFTTYIPQQVKERGISFEELMEEEHRLGYGRDPKNVKNQD